jgi:hypothetical protein
MNTKTCLCNHYVSSFGGGTYYNSRDNKLYDSLQVDTESLKHYLNCKTCVVLTPTVYSNFTIGRTVALSKIIYYAVLRPFAALCSLCIPTKIDTTQHPFLAKIGRVLTAPVLYYLVAKKEYKGYTLGGTEGKILIINAQYSRHCISRMIYTSDTKEINDISNGNDQQRLLCLRLQEPSVYSCSSIDPHGRKYPLFKTISFKDLIDAGYIRTH